MLTSDTTYSVPWRPSVVGYSDRYFYCDGFLSTLSSAMSSSNNSDWHVHSLMLSFHDLRCLLLLHLPSTVSCTMIFGIVFCWQTWPNHGSFWRLTIKALDVQWGHWPVAIYIVYFVFVVWYAKHPPVAFKFQMSQTYTDIDKVHDTFTRS